VKLPKDLSSTELVIALEILGYEQTRQTGSHIRLTTQRNGVHHITIPVHKNLKIGTLAFIFSNIAVHFGTSKKELSERLF